ncbi:MAG: NFACT family protein [Spirochaetales bacterium]|uniref:NFACT family protein n=1 Tax=Candidatus Thalassospirochaeta sargassi TaxID=3119039 RepID=A0AAJ1IFV1_9SPIO|nr:NFACT family protein [Spirochaetales bacterium]
MSLNYKEIDCIVSEIDIVNSHLQKIKQPNFHTLYLEFYKPGGRFGINICLAPGKTRLHLVPGAPANEIKLQRFAQFMRSRIRGGRVCSMEQINSDRIVKMNITRAGEELVLWFRLWSGAANIIATDDKGIVLDAFYRRPGRGEVSGGTFNLPEPKPLTREFSIRELPGEGSFNEKICSFYETDEHTEDLVRFREKVLKKISADEAKAASTLKKLEKKASQYGQFESYKQTGDLLMSNIHLINKGDRWVKVYNYYEDNAEIEIELDQTLSPEKNAENYYNRYRKAKSGIEKVEQDIANHKLIIRNLQSDRERMEAEEDISILKEFLNSIPKQISKDIKERAPGLSYRSGPYTILVGRSAAENDKLLRNWVRGNDVWLHTRDYPGGYVFIKTIKGKSVPLENLLDAGNLALFYSKGRNSGRGELYYTQVKYLRRAKDGPRGLVLPTQEKNLTITLEQQRLNRMMGVED